MYEFSTRVRYSETDEAKKLTLPALVNYFQDCAVFHSEDVGLSVGAIARDHMAWILLTWQIGVERMPDLGETVRVVTNPYRIGGCLGLRNFGLFASDGTRLAAADSAWALLDTENGRLTRMPPDFAEQYGVGKKWDLGFGGVHIRTAGETAEQEPARVSRYMLDSNCHMNNDWYVRLAMGCLPEGFIPVHMKAEYKRSAVLDDLICPATVQEDGRVLVLLRDEEKKPYANLEFTGRADD